MVDDSIPPLPENWNRCHAYNERKRRYCRQMPVPIQPGQFIDKNQPRYCGNHRHLLDEWLSKNHHLCEIIVPDDVKKNNKSKRPRTDSPNTEIESGKQRKKKDRGKRVPCPIDPSHFIFESAIARHVLVCPAVKERQEVAGKDYYSEGINLGGFGSMGSLCQECPDESSVRDLEKAKKLACSILRVFHRIFLTSDGSVCMMDELDGNENSSKLSDQELQNITEKEIYDALSEVDLSQVEEGISGVTPSLSSTEVHDNEPGAKHVKSSGRLTHAIAKHRIKAGGPRHLRQIASILGHVRQLGLISTNISSDGKNPLIVEMGAGRGMTGLVVAGATGASLGNNIDVDPSPRVNLHLVERSGTRGKAETKIRAAEGKHSKEDCLRLDLVDVTRVKCDLAHVNMSTALPSQLRSNSSKTVVVAKHLCGAGTDIALKSLRGIRTIDGCIMATCCHGLCSWSEYVGRDCFLRLFCSELGGLSIFGEKEFNLLKRWTSASVLEDSHISEAGSRTSTDVIETKEEHYTENAEEEKGRFPSIFTVVKDLGLACGGKGLGRACQRLIDFGRCEYMRNDLFAPDSSSDDKCFNVGILHYVSRDVTPQNALLLASRN